MPESAFAAARESHGTNNPVIRMGMYVPTRREVSQMPAEELAEVLDLWMWEGPTELIPTDKQIHGVRDVLLSRPDATSQDIQNVIAECDRYLRNS
jgi:hypothetical protein